MSNVDVHDLSGRLHSGLAEIQRMLRDERSPSDGFFDGVGLRIEADRLRYAAHFALPATRANLDV